MVLHTNDLLGKVLIVSLYDEAWHEAVLSDCGAALMHTGSHTDWTEFFTEVSFLKLSSRPFPCCFLLTFLVSGAFELTLALWPLSNLKNVPRSQSNKFPTY